MTRSHYWRFVLDRIDFLWRLLGVSLLFVVMVDIALKIVFVAADPDLVNIPDFDAESIARAYGQVDWIAEFTREEGAVGVRAAPYVYWMAAQQTGRYINVNRDGLRYVRHRPPPGCTSPVRIFVFGGSTVFGYPARDDFTLPSALQHELEAKGKCAEVSNFGQDGYVSTQEMLLFQVALRHGNRPDIAIFYDGWNDAESALENADVGLTDVGLTYGEADRARELNLTNPFHLRDRVRLYKIAAVSLVSHSGLGIAARHILKLIAPRTYQNIKGQLVRVPGQERPNSAALARNVVDVYLNNVAFTKAIALRFGVRCLFYWQPCLHTKHVLSKYESFQKSLLPPQEIGFIEQVYRDAAAMTSREGVVYLAEVFGNSVDLYYVDCIHITEAGNRVIAQAIVRDQDFLNALSSARSERDGRRTAPAHSFIAGQAAKKGALAPLADTVRPRGSLGHGFAGELVLSNLGATLAPESW